MFAEKALSSDRITDYDSRHYEICLRVLHAGNTGLGADEVLWLILYIGPSGSRGEPSRRLTTTSQVEGYDHAFCFVTGNTEKSPWWNAQGQQAAYRRRTCRLSTHA